MKTNSLLAFSFLASVGIASAQTAPPTSPTSPVSPTPNAFQPPSKSWLASRGVLSVADLSALTGVQFSPAEKARLEVVVTARNAELERVNAQLSAQLGQILKEGEAQTAARIETRAAQSADDEMMERLKRRQPSRYRELMRRKAAEGKGTGK